MHRILASKATQVWLMLIAATGASWLLVSRGDATVRGDFDLASIVVISIAMMKIRLVLIHFMELRRAPLVWRVVFEAWIVVVGVAMLLIYSVGATMSGKVTG